MFTFIRMLCGTFIFVNIYCEICFSAQISIACCYIGINRLVRDDYSNLIKMFLCKYKNPSAKATSGIGVFIESSLPGCYHFFEILATNYGPGPYAPAPYGPGPLIIWKNILSQICSRSIIWMHTIPWASLLYAPGAVCILSMVLEHIWLRIFFQIINGPWSYGLKHMVQEHKSMSKSQKSGGYPHLKKFGYIMLFPLGFNYF